MQTRNKTKSVGEINANRAEIAKLLKEEIQTLSEDLEETNQGLNQLKSLIEKAGYKVKYEDGALTLEKEVDGHQMRAVFYFNEDQQGEEGEQDEDNQSNSEDDQPTDDGVTVEVDIEIRKQNSPVYLAGEGYIQEGEVTLSILRAGKDGENGEEDIEGESRAVHIDDLSEQLQIKLNEYFKLFGLESVVVNAVEYLSQAQSQSFVENLNSLQSFFTNK